MDCKKCKIQDDCSIYQAWLNTRDCCCPYSDYQKGKKSPKLEPLEVGLPYTPPNNKGEI